MIEPTHPAEAVFAPPSGPPMELDVVESELPPAGLGLRLYDDLITFATEVSEPGRRVETVTKATLGVLGQAVDRARVSAILLPHAFEESLEFSARHGLNGYGTAGVSGAIVGGLGALWLWGVGKSFQESLEVLPVTTEKVAKNHPVMVEVISDALGGFPDQEKVVKNQGEDRYGEYEVWAYDARETVVGKVASGTARSLSAGMVYGTTAYVGVSKVRGYSEESTSRFRRATTVEGSLFLGSLAVGVSSLITHDALGLAEDVKNTVSNEKLWMAFAAASIAYASASNWRARRKAKAQGPSQESSD
jgi:hypothetical protein